MSHFAADRVSKNARAEGLVFYGVSGDAVDVLQWVFVTWTEFFAVILNKNANRTADELIDGRECKRKT